MALLAAVVFGCTIASGDDIADDRNTPPASATSADEALRSAEAAIQRATEAGNLWLGTRRLWSSAARHQRAGEYSRALSLARAAEREARLALNQARLERARYLLQELPAATDPEDVETARRLLAAHEGEAALRLIRSMAGK